MTHAVDEPKHADLVAMRLPCIEVDLSSMVGHVFSFDALEQVVIQSTVNKRWLYHPRQAEWEALLLSGFEAWRKSRLADLARRLESLPPPSSRQPQTEVYRDANAKYRALPDEEKWRRLERQLGVPRQKFPSHMRAELRQGGDILPADKSL